MPTGYTAPVESGEITDLRPFVLRCARAFGATIMQRDESLDVPPESRVASDYYATALAEAQERVKTFKTMTGAAATRRAAAEYKKALQSRAETVTRCAVHAQRYRAMLAKVQEWEPPTADHVELKSFMVQQLTESLKYQDFEWPRPVLLSGGEWLVQAREKAARDVESYGDEVRKETERVEEANRWIRELYDSLATVSA